MKGPMKHKVTKVDIAGYDDVYIRTLNMSEVTFAMEDVDKSGVDYMVQAAKAVCVGMCDADGKRVFSNDQWNNVLSDLPYEVLIAVANKMTEYLTQSSDTVKKNTSLPKPECDSSAS